MFIPQRLCSSIKGLFCDEIDLMGFKKTKIAIGAGLALSLFPGARLNPESAGETAQSHTPEVYVSADRVRSMKIEDAVMAEIAERLPNEQITIASDVKPEFLAPGEIAVSPVNNLGCVAQIGVTYNYATKLPNLSFGFAGPPEVFQGTEEEYKQALFGGVYPHLEVGPLLEGKNIVLGSEVSIKQAVGYIATITDTVCPLVDSPRQFAD